MTDIYDEIRAERTRQDAKFGPQSHSPLEWLPILVEEVGEVSREVCENHHSWYYGKRDHENYRNELIHVAAVCVHMIECIDGKAE
jgi:NTP pyrophosphatase (non-canonical NTP hydrolase)